MSVLFVVCMVVYAILLFELIYFMVTTLYYIYKNPQYRAFWAVFCIAFEPVVTEPIDIVEIIDSNSNEDNTLDSHDVIVDEEKIETKESSFILYGLETISHCFILLLFLTCCTIYISIICYLTYLTEYDLWSEHTYLCQYGVKYRLVALIFPNYYFLIFLLCTVIKTEYLCISWRNSKINIYLSVFTIIWCVICSLMDTISATLTKYTVASIYKNTSSVCYPIGGIGTNTILIMYNNIQFGVCIALTFISVLMPLYSQRKMLKNLPNSCNNENIKRLLKKIHNFQKRLAIPGISFSLIIIFLIHRNLIFTINDYNVGVGLFLLHLIVYVHLYIVMIFIVKDYKQILCPICYISKTVNKVDLSQEPISSLNKRPQLVKDITMQEMESET
eukprot:93934_1